MVLKLNFFNYRWQKTISTFAILSFWLLGLSAQSTLQFQNFTQKDGLASNYVLSFLQDHLGYVWIGTESGLNRFDGQHFLHFGHDPEDPETLNDDWVHTVFEDSKHNLWAGTEKGLNRLNRKTGKIERIPMFKEDQKIEVGVNKFSEDAKGNLWLFTIGEGLFQLKRQADQENKWSAEHFAYQDTLSSTTNQATNNYLHVATPEVLWVGNHSAIKRLHIPSRTLTYYYVSKLNGSDRDTLEIIKSSYLEDGKILIYTQGNFHVLDTKADVLQVKPLGSVALQAIEERTNVTHLNFLKDSEEGLFISIFRDLFSFNIQTGKLESILPRNQTSNRSLPNFVRFPYKDRQGNIWVGTMGSGFYLGRKEESPFTLFQNDPTDMNSVSSGQVRTLAEDGNGNLWAGILNHGLDQFAYQNDGRLLKKRSIVPTAGQPNTLVSNRVIKLIQGSEKELWIATLTHGIQKMDETGAQFTLFDHQSEDTTSLSANRIWGLTKDQEGYIWAGSWQDGLNRINPRTGRIKRFHHDPSNANSLISDDIRCLYVDRQGFLWIGTEQGLDRYDPATEQFTHFKHEPDDPTSLSDGLVWAIFVDRNGALWVGTNTGLNRYDATTQQFKRFFKKDGLPNNTIYGILEDDAGVLWVSTENGLARQLSPGSDPAFFPLGQEDGLQTTSFVPKAYLNSSSSEQLFFGSTQGILGVKPSLLQLDTPQPQLGLHALSTFNPYKREGKRSTNYFINSVKEPFKLGYQDQSLILTLSDLNWKGNGSLRYDYQLVGFDQQWMPLEKNLQFTFSNLPPGKYRLQARARNAENVSSLPTEILRLRVYPPWWKSWWAYLLYIVVSGVGIYTVYRFQLRRQLEKQEADSLKRLDAYKNKLFTDITHEFRTPLTIIKGMADKIKENPSQWVTKGSTMISRNSTDLLNLVNQMLELRKVETGRLTPKMIQGDIIPFITSIFEQFSAIAESKRLKMELVSAMTTLQMDYDREKTLGILSNLLSNAIKYTPEEGLVVLSLSMGHNPNLDPQDCLKITVKDSGQGIPKEQLPKIFDRYYQSTLNEEATVGTGIGLSLTKELVGLLNGDIDVKSKETQGTTFRVFLPITQKAALANEIDPMEVQSAVLGANKLTQLASEITRDLPLALIVEDNEDIAQYLEICLTNDYKLEFALNGQEGIDKGFEITPNIIISDVMMPKKNGFELVETLKTDIRTSHIPIILLTAKSDMASRIAGLKQGADDYLAKPFNEEELLIRMQNLIEIRRKLQNRYQNIYEQPLLNEKLATPNIEDEFILQLKEIFEEKIDDPNFDHQQLSKALFLSRSQLGRKVKALTGKSLSSYLKSLRMQKARQLLLTTDDPIIKVALEVGISNSSYFSRLYSEEFGESPTSTRS